MKAVELFRYFLVLTFLFVLIGTKAWSQTLHKEVTFGIEEATVEEALVQLESVAGVQLAYNPDQVNATKSIAVPAGQYSVEDCIRMIVGAEVQLKERGRHILVQTSSRSDQNREKQQYIIEGYIYDRLSGKTVANATVYQIDRKYTASTNENGYYSLELTDRPEYLNLGFSKRSYFDTIVIIQPEENHIIKNVFLEPRPKAPEPMPTRDATITVRPKEVEELPLVRAIVSMEQVDRAGNLDFLREVPVQFSLIPSIGTNKFTSGISENNFSLNLLAGYNSGLKGIEIGGLVNVLRNDAYGLQVGGLGNIVGGKVNGLQIGGLFNNNRGSLYGLQVGGLYNIVLDTIYGGQIGGLFNTLHGSITGAQVGGLFNIATEDMTGAQIGGLFNHTRKDLTYGQVGGLFNYSGKTEGIQIAGLFNSTKDSCAGYQLGGLWNFAGNTVSGGQMAGLANIAPAPVAGFQVSGLANAAGEVKGTQVASINKAGDVAGTQVGIFFNKAGDIKGVQVSLVNFAGDVNGTQVGLLNFADSSDKSFGFLSFAWKGYHHLELFADEIHPGNVAFRTGWKKLHNIFRGGYGSWYGHKIWSYGYGVGSDILEKGRSGLTIEATGTQLMPVPAAGHAMNLVTELGAIYRLAIFKGKVHLSAGADFNLLISTGPLVKTPLGEGLGGEWFPPIFENRQSETRVFAWPGVKVGIRI